MKYLLTLFLFLSIFKTHAQTTQEKLQNARFELVKLQYLQDSVYTIIETLTQKHHVEKILSQGLPELEENEEVICHSAMCLLYSEKYKMAKWVVHIISGDILDGKVNRTNNFREDPKIPHTTVEEDFFVQIPQSDGSIHFKGFGYDRGHLAPSADFKWSETALSESYYYSNITPQTPEFNRGKWAEIESFLRSYIYNNPNSYLHVVTAPVLKEGLPIIEKSVNKISIPEYHYKIAADLDKNVGIAFLVPQRDINYPIEWYAVTIDSIETLTGINFFPTLTSEQEVLIESQFNISDWLPKDSKHHALPLKKEEIPKNAYNSVDARNLVGYHKERTVCGTVVDSHKSKKGNVFLNFDQKFPNSLFSVTIFEKDIMNFSYEPELYFINKQVCVTGKVTEYKGNPSMTISSERKIFLINKN